MCECQQYSQIEKALAERNTRIGVGFVLTDEGLDAKPIIMTEQIEKGRGKPKALVLFPTYCPFCGKPYRSKSDAEEPTHTDTAPKGCAAATVDALTEEYGST